MVWNRRGTEGGGVHRSSSVGVVMYYFLRLVASTEEFFVPFTSFVSNIFHKNKQSIYHLYWKRTDKV